MKIAVLVKQVPGAESPLPIRDQGDWIKEISVTYEMNESDNYALEEGLRMRESKGEGEVVAVTLGPDRVQKILREALAKGADRGIHIKTDSIGDFDPLSIARRFSDAMAEEKFDLILSGLQSDDLGFGQTGLLIGEMLGMSTASLVMETKVTDGVLKVKRELEAGWFQWVTMSLPASITIQSGLNTPRYPSLKGIMGAKKKEIKVVEPDQGEALQTLGAVSVPKSEKRTVMLEGNSEQIVDQLLEAFKTDIKIL